MRTKRCSLCGKSVNIENFVASINFEIWGMQHGQKEDCENSEENDVCNSCFQEMKIIVSLLSQKPKLLYKLREFLHSNSK